MHIGAASRWPFALAAIMCSTTALAHKPTVILVHGAFENASVWQQVQKRLKADGFKSIAIDLPGRADVPLPKVGASLDLYRDTVLRVVSGQSSPVVLVGHSFGGMTISSVAESAPEKIKALVYVAAYLPASGQSLVSLSQTDKASRMGPAFRVSEDKSTASIDPAARGDLFCNDCGDALKKTVAASIISEPLAPMATPIKLTADHFGKVRKVYVHTSTDVVVSPSLQAAMVAATPVQREVTIDSGHSPFMTEPTALAKAIEAAAH